MAIERTVMTAVWRKSTSTIPHFGRLIVLVIKHPLPPPQVCRDRIKPAEIELPAVALSGPDQRRSRVVMLAGVLERHRYSPDWRTAYTCRRRPSAPFPGGDSPRHSVQVPGISKVTAAPPGHIRSA